MKIIQIVHHTSIDELQNIIDFQIGAKYNIRNMFTINQFYEFFENIVAIRLPDNIDEKYITFLMLLNHLASLNLIPTGNFLIANYG